MGATRGWGIHRLIIIIMPMIHSIGFNDPHRDHFQKRSGTFSFQCLVCSSFGSRHGPSEGVHMAYRFYRFVTLPEQSQCRIERVRRLEMQSYFREEISIVERFCDTVDRAGSFQKR